MMPSDQELEMLLTMEQTVKALSLRIAIIKDACKAIGSFSTENYVVAVVEQARRGVAPLKDVEEVFGPEILEQSGLIRVSVFQVVKIAPKLLKMK